jgi:hypothetical protein
LKIKLKFINNNKPMFFTNKCKICGFTEKYIRIFTVVVKILLLHLCFLIGFVNRIIIRGDNSTFWFNTNCRSVYSGLENV